MFGDVDWGVGDFGSRGNLDLICFGSNKNVFLRLRWGFCSGITVVETVVSRYDKGTKMEWTNNRMIKTGSMSWNRKISEWPNTKIKMNRMACLLTWSEMDWGSLSEPTTERGQQEHSSSGKRLVLTTRTHWPWRTRKKIDWKIWFDKPRRNRLVKKSWPRSHIGWPSKALIESLEWEIHPKECFEWFVWNSIENRKNNTHRSICDRMFALSTSIPTGFYRNKG